jgi:hypothetical protein
MISSGDELSHGLNDSTTSILTEAAARKGHIDVDVIQRLAPSLEASLGVESHGEALEGVDQPS